MKCHFIVLTVICLLLPTVSAARSAEWIYFDNLGTRIEAISMIDSGKGWAALYGSNGAVCHFDGSSWTLMTELYPGDNGSNYGIYALDPWHIWVTGHFNSSNRGRIYFSDGSKWFLQTEIAGTNWWIYDAYAADENNVWAVGPAGSIYYSPDSGTNWTIQTDTGGDYWFSIAGLGRENVWAVGDSNPARIAYYNGTSWAIETAFNTQTNGQYLRSVSAAPPDQVWAAVEDGTVLRRIPGGEWTVSTVLSEQGNNEANISVYNDKNIGLVMDSDASGIYFCNGTDWELQTDIYLATALDYSHGPRAWAGDIFGGMYFKDISGSPNYRTDYDGDGTSDIAVFRDTSGLWAVRGITRFYYGAFNDDPVPADYDGDGTTDPALFRSWFGLWAIRGQTRVYFGGSTDVPLAADFDGDGTYDPSIFRSSSGLWASRGVTRLYFGSSGDSPRPGYYLGGPAMEVGLFRGNSGLWAVRGLTRFYFGGSTDTAEPADYDGDGIWDPGIFRSSAGLWAVRDITRCYFGALSDLPVPAAYSGGLAVRIGVFRDTSGLWAVKGVTKVYFGAGGDLPVVR